MEYPPTILPHSFDAMICFGESQQVVVWNAEATRIFGLSEAEALGRKPTELGAAENWSGILPLVHAAHEGEQLQRVEQTLILPNKNKAVLDIMITRVSGEGDAAPAVIVMVRDVTVTRQAQESIRQGEERFRFRSDLGEATRTLTDPEQIRARITRLLGQHLRASGCAYADVEADSDQFTIRQDYTDGGPSITGEYHVTLFGPRASADMLAGTPLVI